MSDKQPDRVEASQFRVGERVCHHGLVLVVGKLHQVGSRVV